MSAITNNIKYKTPEIVTGALTFVAGLAWNEAFKSMIDTYAPATLLSSKNMWYKILYAVVVTLFAILLITGISVVASYDGN